MRILDRYVLKPVLATFLGCLLVFIFLYIISDILGHLDDILKNRASLSILYQYYLTYFPVIFTQTSPIAIMLATIYNFGRLNRSNELIAMRSSGLSLWQITAPVLIIGLILSFVILLTNEKILPSAQAQTEKLKEQIEKSDRPKSKEQTIHNLTFYGLGNRLFFVNTYNIKGNTMEGISILEHDRRQNIVAKIVARKGVYKDDSWTFYGCARYNFDEHGQITGDTYYNDEQVMDITETPQDLLQQRKRPEFMSTDQLEDYIWRLRKSGATAALRYLSVDLYQRYASAFSSLVLILIGIPFSFVIRKRANIFSSFGVCIGISFLYYVLNAISLSLGKNGLLFPILAAWIIPIAFSLTAVNSISKSA